jgi:predicted phosphodiesterase
MNIKKSELANKIIKEFTKNGVSVYSKKKLGEILYQRYPDLFKNPEDGREKIRYVTGSAGNLKRNVLAKDSKSEWNGFNIPKPEKNDYSKVVVNQKRIGILSDIHFPYYEEAALNAAISFLIEWKPDCVILNGDIIDCYHLSNFEKDKRQRSFKYELDMLKGFFVELRELFPKIRIVYKLGNHEDRYEKQILQNIPELIELEYFNFENVIEAKKYGIEVVKSKRVILAGKLNIIHGHELPRGMAAPVNPARGFFLRTKASTIGGHHHQTSEHIENDLNNNLIGAFSTGCLCELNPNYMPINKWNHGFAVVENYGDDYMVRNLKIIKGKVL